jgi:hypothetical protein
MIYARIGYRGAPGCSLPRLLNIIATLSEEQLWSCHGRVWCLGGCQKVDMGVIKFEIPLRRANTRPFRYFWIHAANDVKFIVHLYVTRQKMLAS